MKDWFRDKLKGSYFDNKIIGSYDQNKECYNLTFDSGASFNANVDLKSAGSSVTVTYKEDVKGWVSFKSFIPESGVSCANTYFTFREGKIWEHNQNDNATRNDFYNNITQSFITAVLNEAPTTVKHFNTLNYDGTDGWSCDNIITDIEEATIIDFINKENKYFGSIVGDDSNNDTSSFGFQGIGIANSIS